MHVYSRHTYILLPEWCGPNIYFYMYMYIGYTYRSSFPVSPVAVQTYRHPEVDRSSLFMVIACYLSKETCARLYVLYKRIGYICIYTQGLSCSSFLVMTYFLFRDYDILPKKELLWSPWVYICVCVCAYMYMPICIYICIYMYMFTCV